MQGKAINSLPFALLQCRVTGWSRVAGVPSRPHTHTLRSTHHPDLIHLYAAEMSDMPNGLPFEKDGSSPTQPGICVLFCIEATVAAEASVLLACGRLPLYHCLAHFIRYISLMRAYINSK